MRLLRQIWGYLTQRDAPPDRIVTTDVSGCARCGDDHESLTFRRLGRPIAGRGISLTHTHWSPCPTTGEPIIMAIVDSVDVEVVERGWL